ncbi:glutathionyl-hydroquinone reductase YqjG-like [Xenia sp. Carnegie-2017]|uniref:glutathionyl-hydroquinone reductase YqjG-like n=1 Tax=Xenia sp. Carnegie-2017 TaxID=2897299 RepID=UPI001F0371FF|nr:glutathionyl-hydroquinone reductase YqjG-like [Xenia sp. Carnegie-2017]
MEGSSSSHLKGNVGSLENREITEKGEYVRPESGFRNWISADGTSGFKAEAGRYHLYVCYGCPWAHRTLILRKLKGLENVIAVDFVDWLLKKPEGWRFSKEKSGCTRDTVNNFEFLSEVYKLSNPTYSGNWTVPVLFDKTNKVIVSNESSDIIRMLNTEFNDFCETENQANLDLYPIELREKIDGINEWVYSDINNGVYRCGFASSQEAYDKAVLKLFESLDKVEHILAKNRYLTGAKMTEADIRLFVTLIRFDVVYHCHFKCNKKRILDYPNLYGFMKDIYQSAGIASTVNFDHIKKLYQVSQSTINPYGIVAIGPDLDLMSFHGRGEL